MQLSNRESKLIYELIHNEGYVTGQHLANLAGVTVRTIRADIAEINNKLSPERIFIYSVPGSGYYIPDDNKAAVIKAADISKDYIVPIMPGSRVDYIIEQLILNPEGISSDSIAAELYISKSTFGRDLLMANEILKEKGLRLSKKTGKDIKIQGNEITIRKVYMDFLSKAAKSRSLGQNIKSKELSEIFSDIKEKVHEFTESNGISLTGDEFDAVIVFITVVVFRNRRGHVLDSYDKDTGSISRELSLLLETSAIEISSSIYEQRYAADYLKDFFTDEADKAAEKNYDKVFESAIDELTGMYSFAFSDEIKRNLCRAITIEHRESYSEYTISEISREYPLMLEIAASLLNIMSRKTGLRYGADELIRVVMLLACAQEQDMLEKELKERDVAVLCQSGIIERKLLETKIKRYFPKFNIVGFFPLYKVQKAAELKPEIIISTTAIESSDAPVIVINPLFKDYDVLKIQTAIKQIEQAESVGYQFNNLFREDLFLKDFEAFSKHEAIKQLYDIMQTNGYAGNDFLQDVFERENISSTSIGNMVAIPHAISKGAGEDAVAAGILKRPIDWNGERVQLIFLINITRASKTNVKQIFESFFDLISASGKVERLIKSKNYYEFIKTINQ